MTYRFDRDTRVVREDDGRYQADLSAAWNIGAVPDGGYQAAAACRAALDQLEARDVLNVTSYFLAPAAPGPVTLAVEIAKRGRSTSLAQVSLFQDDRERMRSLVLAGDLDTLSGPELHRSGPPTLPRPEACPRVPADLPLRPALMNEVDVCLDPSTTSFLRSETGAAPELRGWLRFADGRPTDVLALALFADAFPPTTFNYLGVTGWVPTLELTTQIRRRPAPGWIRARVSTQHISAGHFEEDGELWDEDDRLVAVFRQRAQILSR